MKINLKTKTMNTVARGVVFVMGISLFTACTEENVLELEPFNQVSEDAAFSTPALIELSLTGMYNAAQRGDYVGQGRGYPFGAASIQQGDNRGEDVVNTQTFYQLTYTGTYDPSTLNNVFMWSDTYRLINRANIVIQGVNTAIENGVITQEVGDDYLGQAKFMRAIAHLELISHFAKPYETSGSNSNLGIPYREIPFTTEANIEAGIAQGRNTVHEVYTKIIADLDEAEGLLKTKAERGGTLGIVRATMEAAIAYKTRAYLHMREWQKVITEGEKILGDYSLTADPNDVFENGYNNSESIFSMENTANNNPGVNAALGSQYNRRALVVISPIVWRNEFWLPNDLRRSEDLVSMRSGIPHTNKYKDDVNYSDATPLMRYAEVLLNVAEAYARLDRLAEALDLLNEVRDRSLPAGAASYSAFGSKEDLLRAIIAERRIEFVMEGKRWQDIHRLQVDTFVDYDGVPAKVANGFPPASAYTLGTPYSGPYGVEAIPYSDFRFLWPIPQQEMNNNPNMVQNPGWE
ncbi:RagB/SusD family nutrient uptake outer membrane protein [Antarcticibacterium arcticum]|uniref:RagB/SusD family nutrient uptake outer membrane protein n=1 Tax=Antarcticibacterium arcticum TaxID=2585771 RepID=A0A5B8YLC8_9FLAO|nr:RagB/SusD family nutrient uptake outer membrane protein [Antarcticibacterium arcticum]QED38810.1 RagB/SusD family nutrient uptake outer membrane protein [Antarcticibacterium arcticum]